MNLSEFINFLETKVAQGSDIRSLIAELKGQLAAEQQLEAKEVKDQDDSEEQEFKDLMEKTTPVDVEVTPTAGAAATVSSNFIPPTEEASIPPIENPGDGGPELPSSELSAPPVSPEPV